MIGRGGGEMEVWGIERFFLFWLLWVCGNQTLGIGVLGRIG